MLARNRNSEPLPILTSSRFVVALQCFCLNQNCSELVQAPNPDGVIAEKEKAKSCHLCETFNYGWIPVDLCILWCIFSRGYIIWLFVRCLCQPARGLHRSRVHV